MRRAALSSSPVVSSQNGRTVGRLLPVADGVQRVLRAVEVGQRAPRVVVIERGQRVRQRVERLVGCLPAGDECVRGLGGGA